MKISLIVAMSQDRAIGHNNSLLWHLPNDLKRFKMITTGQTILMGRKTFESLPNGPLPNRRNIVISSSYLKSNNYEIYPSISEALHSLNDRLDEIFIIGGGAIYEQTLHLANEVHLTIVDAEFPNADTRFPILDLTAWEIKTQIEIPADEKNKLSSTYYHLIRK